MEHKAFTAHIRHRIKVAGIKAKVKMQNYCGVKVVAVDVISFNASFTEEDQREIKLIALCNRLTLCRGLEITMDTFTNPKDFKFYI